MKKGIYLFTGLVLIISLLNSCKKDDNTTTADPCQTDPAYWTSLTVDGDAVDTRGACNLAYIELDSVYQYFHPTMFGSNYLVTAASVFTLYDDTTYMGRLNMQLSVLAPDSIVDVTINGTDTARNIPLQTLCYLLHTGELVFFQSQMQQEDKNGGFISYTGADTVHYQLNTGTDPEMDILGNEGLGQALLDGDTTDVCICQVGFKVDVTNGNQTNTIELDGLSRLPFK